MSKNIPSVPTSISPGAAVVNTMAAILKAAANMEINTRRAVIVANYKQEPKDKYQSIGSDVESMTYTDSAGESSDSIEITINAQNIKWLKLWMPKIGASIKPNIVGKYWNKDGKGKHTIKCGLFVLDDISYSDRPSTLTVGGVSKPAADNFSAKSREKVWKNTSVKRIAKTIAERYKLNMTFDAEDYDIKCYEQDDTDGSFLNDLCQAYGLVLKIYAKRMWIYDREQYKKKKAVKTFTPENIVRGSLKWNTTLSGTYDAGEFSYTDSDRNIDIIAKVGPKGSNHVLSVNQRASSVKDAAIQLCAALNNANHGTTKISFQVDGEWKVCSGHVIKITGYGKGMTGGLEGLNGKYFVDKVTHSISSDGGFTSDIECSLITKPFNSWDVGGKIKKSKNASRTVSGSYSGGGGYQTPAAAAAESDSYRIKAGDCVKIMNAPYFESASAPQPMTVTKTGVYYFYDGILVNGRYRLVNSKERCGKASLSTDMSGWVPKQFCQNVVRSK